MNKLIEDAFGKAQKEFQAGGNDPASGLRAEKIIRNGLARLEEGFPKDLPEESKIVLSIVFIQGVTYAIQKLPEILGPKRKKKFLGLL